MTLARFSGVVLALGLLACSSDPEVTQGKSKSLVLLYTSDEHSQLFAISPELDDYPLATTEGSGELVGGVARRAALFESERSAAQAAGKSVLTVIAGDNTMGTLAVVGFRSDGIDYGTMVKLGYDVTTLGNHEFDYGPDALAESLSAAKAGGGAPPIVASNIHFSDTDAADDALAAHFSEDATDGAMLHRTRIVTTPEGVRVGFVGFVGVNASDVAPNKAPVAFSELGVEADQSNDPDVVLPKLYAELQPLVDELRPKVDLVVALSHAGVQNPAAPDNGEDTLIAEHVAGIDAIVSGHTHNSEAEAIMVQGPDREVAILNGGARGGTVGRAEWKLGSGGAVYQPDGHAMVGVDDHLVPSTDLVDVDALLASLEKAGTLDGKSYLEGLLSRVEGADVMDDPAKPGDLYFRPLGSTSFDVWDTHAVLFLSADAQLRAMDAVEPVQMGLQSAGVIRSRLRAGKTGVISAADAFDVVPLGASPLDGTVGYPLVVARLSIFYVRGIFEFSAAWGPENSDFDLAPAGVMVEYDCSRPKVEQVTDLLDASKGIVEKIWIDSDHSNGTEDYDLLIWDRTDPSVSPKEPISIVTSSYICQFADAVGATPLGADGKPTTCADAIVKDAENREIKEAQAFMSLLRSFPSGIPALYDSQSSARTARFGAFPACH